MTDIPSEKLIDGLVIPCSQKHGLVVARCRELLVEDWFVLRNGHAPEPLRFLMEAHCPGAFRWDYLRDEPGLAEVRITKLRALSPRELDACASTPKLTGGCGHHD